MTKQSWLPLTDYSTRYKVSISTLRRKIKSEKIQFRFDDGKYFILDSPVERPTKDALVAQVSLRKASEESAVNNPMVVTANRMLDELKKAYMLILQEKEEQILQLKGEIADLRTLARVFEEENNRLNALLQKGDIF